ncbi:cyclin-dependent kinase inhibitor 1C-like [Silurus asotus]|uniref:Cyclin-dependent kinase inhibitor 1C-like n=1 Tax=Silurus asotus TaxID=30991 RepID=A0AAD5AFL7_SILAS|nr:cyclin-dependent kinase inhibitor 1C-like [Silurus asotus]
MASAPGAAIVVVVAPVPPPSNPPRRRSNVRRSLFGAVDHDELQREVDSKLREISERDRRRWNFDFASGTPLDGDYEWEGAAAERTPVFYQESLQVGKKRVALAAAATPPERENSAARGSDGDGKPSARLVAATTTTRITDFFVKRRRKHGEELKRRGAPNPFGSMPSEQTPRKRLR